MLCRTDNECHFVTCFFAWRCFRLCSCSYIPMKILHYFIQFYKFYTCFLTSVYLILFIRMSQLQINQNFLIEIMRPWFQIKMLRFKKCSIYAAFSTFFPILNDDRNKALDLKRCRAELVQVASCISL